MTTPKGVLLIISDLLFQSRVREQASALGYEVSLAETDAAVRDALTLVPGLVVLDLHIGDVDWRQAVARAKEQDVPVLAFGRHTEADLLRSAREAGCDRVVPRSTLVEELPQLIVDLAGAS